MKNARYVKRARNVLEDVESCEKEVISAFTTYWQRRIKEVFGLSLLRYKRKPPHDSDEGFSLCAFLAR